MSTQSPTIHIRLSNEDYAKLKTRADESRRSVATQARIEIESGLERVPVPVVLVTRCLADIEAKPKPAAKKAAAQKERRRSAAVQNVPMSERMRNWRDNA